MGGPLVCSHYFLAARCPKLGPPKLDPLLARKAKEPPKKDHQQASRLHFAHVPFSIACYHASSGLSTGNFGASESLTCFRGPGALYCPLNVTGSGLMMTGAALPLSDSLAALLGGNQEALIVDLRREYGRLYAWACQRLYGELAWAYEPVSWLISAGRWAAWRELAMDYVPAGSRILEVGFGTGQLLRAMAARGDQVCGIEPSPTMQRIASRKLRHRQAAPRSEHAGSAQLPGRVRGRAQALPFPDGYFGAVVATFPAGFVISETALTEFARVLRPAAPPAREPDAASGGRLVIVGLAVSLTAPVLRAVPIFYGQPAPAMLERWMATVRAAGLQPCTVLRAVAGARVLVVIADRTKAK